jgi:hypothetical protein
MNLTELLERENLRAIEVSRVANINPASLSTHLKYEATGGKEGRPLGIELSLRAIKSYPSLTMEDLRPDWAERLRTQPSIPPDPPDSAKSHLESAS